MHAATGRSEYALRMGRRVCALLVCTYSLLLIAADDPPQEGPLPSAAVAPADSRRSAHLVRVPLPITGTVDERVKLKVDQVLAESSGDEFQPVVILEFWPSRDDTGSGSQFERSLSLARYLASDRLRRARTVAYIPRAVQGHAVLAALACEEIVMHPDAELGDAGINDSAVDPTVRRGYSEIADRTRTFPAAVALGMLDRRLTVYSVETAGGKRYILSGELEALKQETVVKSVETMIAADELGRFTGRQLRNEYGFVTRLVGQRSDLTKVLQLPTGAVLQDPSLGGAWRPIQVELKGTVTDNVVSRVQRSIEDSLRTSETNFVCLWLDSPGGSPSASANMANYLADLDSTKIRTVAYIPYEACGDAALIAIACDNIVMHDDSVLGGAGAYQPDADEVDDLAQLIRDRLAPAKSRSWSLSAAMFDEALVVHEYTMQGTNVREYFAADERDAQVDPQRWVQGPEETNPGQPYRVEGSRAQAVGIAQHVVNGYDELKLLYHLENDPALVKPNWVHTLIEALAAPQIAPFLLMVGMVAMFAEIQAPGIGVGGFLACLCFLLFFWSQFLSQNAGWLEVIMFLAGVTFVAMEIFVISGFGIFGLGGGALIIASLVMASQTFVQFPRNEYQYGQLRDSLLVVGGAGVGVVVAMVVMRRYLHQMPIFQRVMLAPSEGMELEERVRRESIVDRSQLLGKRGNATTRLTPAGKARFGDELVDVVTEGELIPAGAPVHVLEVHGNRVVVASVET